MLNGVRGDNIYGITYNTADIYVHFLAILLKRFQFIWNSFGTEQNYAIKKDPDIDLKIVTCIPTECLMPRKIINDAIYPRILRYQ